METQEDFNFAVDNPSFILAKKVINGINHLKPCHNVYLTIPFLIYGP